MVLTNQGLPSGPRSDENLDRLKWARYSVLGLWACAVLRLLTDNPFNGVATAFAAATGTYTFMNDKRLEGCYQFISTNCVICGPGGTQCMGPFMSISLINAIFDVFRFFSLWNAAMLLIFPLASLAILASVILQCYCFYACLQVFKQIMQPFDSGLPTNESRRPFLGDRSYVSLSAEPGQGPTSAGFVPFGGEGRRLG